MDTSKLPEGVSFSVKGGVLVRELDGAPWDGTKFVVPKPPLNRYAVTVTVDAIDDPTARKFVTDALAAAKVVATVAPLAELLRQG